MVDNLKFLNPSKEGFKRNKMTILELIRKLKEVTHVIVMYDDNDEILDFWSSDYYEELLYPQDNEIIENTEVRSFDFEDRILKIYVECIFS